MARGGIYKSEVLRARDKLLATGRHPSIDSIREELGHTGSKSTIHRYLKELEEEEGQGLGAKVAVSDALQDLIGRLAGRLHEEAEAVVTQAQQRFEVQLQERTQALEQQQQEGTALSTQLQRTDAALQAERADHTATRQALAEATLLIGQLEERAAGLVTRLAENEAHARSLEEKHQHAREALEHYRTSVKEQREQEQRRHEHQVQELQVSLRQANETLTSKNHELLQLNRDNGQWLERHTRLEQELAQVRQAAAGQQGELDALRLTAVEHQALQVRWNQDLQILETLRTELTQARADQLQERQRREQAETDSLRAGVRLETLEQLLAQLSIDRVDPALTEKISSDAKPKA